VRLRSMQHVRRHGEGLTLQDLCTRNYPPTNDQPDEGISKARTDKGRVERRAPAGLCAGAEDVTEELREELAGLRRALRIARGVVYKDDLCHLFEVSASRIQRWGIEPMDPGDIRASRNLYWLPDVVTQLRGSDAAGTDEAQSRIDAVLDGEQADRAA